MAKKKSKSRLENRARNLEQQAQALIKKAYNLLQLAETLKKKASAMESQGKSYSMKDS